MYWPTGRRKVDLVIHPFRRLACSRCAHAAAASTFLAGVFVTALGTRRLWIAGHLVMAVGVVAPVLRAGIGAIMASALLVGGTFTVITMAGFRRDDAPAAPTPLG